MSALRLRPLLLGVLVATSPPSHARASSEADPREQARRAAIHPVSDVRSLNIWLARVPRTKDFPEDLLATLRMQSGGFVIEMTTTPNCVPCGDLWAKLATFRVRYGWQIRTIAGADALLRSARLGLPWVGHPVAWVRPVDDPERMVPVAIGTDHEPNLVRNIYLAGKILTGVRVAVGLRAMSKYTGIVAGSSPGRMADGP